MSAEILDDVGREADRQDEKFGKQDHNALVWLAILAEEFGEVAEATTRLLPPRGRPFDGGNYRAELIQVAAVAIRMVESFDRDREAMATV
jgi:NTP pyrophosphatase (non-canonical NTP hydrolase)